MFSNRERLSCFIVINATFQQVLTELTRVVDTGKGMGWGCVQKYIYLCSFFHWENASLNEIWYLLLLQIVYMYKISINIRIWHREDDVIKVHVSVLNDFCVLLDKPWWVRVLLYIFSFCIYLYVVMSVFINDESLESDFENLVFSLHSYIFTIHMNFALVRF